MKESSQKPETPKQDFAQVACPVGKMFVSFEPQIREAHLRQGVSFPSVCSHAPYIVHCS